MVMRYTIAVSADAAARLFDESQAVRCQLSSNTLVGRSLSTRATRPTRTRWRAYRFTSSALSPEYSHAHKPARARRAQLAGRRWSARHKLSATSSYRADSVPRAGEMPFRALRLYHIARPQPAGAANAEHVTYRRRVGRLLRSIASFSLPWRYQHGQPLSRNSDGLLR